MGKQPHAVRLAVLEERWQGERAALEVRTKYVEWRLENLNGEAARLKTAADLSVTREKFDDYVNTTRLAFDAFKASQDAAFKAYSADMEKRMGAINVKLATWGGALIAAGAIVQYVLKNI